MNIVEELRNKKSEYNRKLLDRAADRIEELEAETKALRQIITDIADAEIRVMTAARNLVNGSEETT